LDKLNLKFATSGGCRLESWNRDGIPNLLKTREKRAQRVGSWKSTTGRQEGLQHTKEARDRLLETTPKFGGKESVKGDFQTYKRKLVYEEMDMGSKRGRGAGEKKWNRKHKTNCDQKGVKNGTRKKK